MISTPLRPRSAPLESSERDLACADRRRHLATGRSKALLLGGSYGGHRSLPKLSGPSEMSRLDEIDAFAARAHAGQVDKQGVDYIEHPRAVAAAVSEVAKPVALLHDVLEDTNCAHDLKMLSDVELDAVLLVTREPADTYSEFIERIARAAGRAGELAREVKIADIRHNLGRLTPELAGMEKRYGRALERLTEVSR